MRKIISILVIMLMISLIFMTYKTYATTTDVDEGLENVINGMSPTTNMANPSDSNIAKTINSVIGVIQMVGTGISLIVITMLGIKYIIASPGEKAETKKQIMPILIGCVLLFGAVNLVAACADLSQVFAN